MNTPASSPAPARKGTGGRPTLEASAALGDAILDTAWRLFVTEGYRQLSVDTIAREAAVSKRTIYDRFGSKEGLFEALVARASSQWSDQAQGVYIENADGDWLRPLVGHVLTLMGGADYLALSSFMTTEARGFPGVTALQSEMGQRSLTAFVAHFQPRILNYPNGEDGRRLAQSILALISGWGGLLAHSGVAIDEAAADRVYNEVRAVLDLYGCGQLINLSRPPA